ncbi:MAG: hypothetical protein A2939_04530 [Parcubacteria group bacterium RIFCSPLOWO2_01_FULL_48_18]|nr:MAG: hypothetical protein A2939_04530 [Parcubacteria group bacterium RIFCSPLOWO2_01_FULL_48_18]
MTSDGGFIFLVVRRMSRVATPVAHIMDNPELRQDIVTGDWVVLAAGRASRPNFLDGAKEKRKRSSLEDCPFEQPQPEKASIIYYTDRDRKEWGLQIVPNKYPVLEHGEVCSVINRYGPYTYATAVGQHDVVITRNHDNNFAMLPPGEANALFRAFKERYQQMAQDSCVNYFFAFHNWGPGAGASIYHPHYQILGLPVVPPDVERSLEGSRNYFEKHRACVHCEMIAWERQSKYRVAFENEWAVAFAPYASRFPFEMKIFPKKHLPNFEETDDGDMRCVVELLQKTLSAMTRELNDPDYNFYIHTAPMRNKNLYEHYHWHIEILPKISVIASVEIGTGIEINTVHPGKAAEMLRERVNARGERLTPDL